MPTFKTCLGFKTLPWRAWVKKCCITCRCWDDGMLCRIQPSNNCTCFECMTIVQSVGSSNKVNFEYGIPLQTYLSFETLAHSTDVVDVRNTEYLHSALHRLYGLRFYDEGTQCCCRLCVGFGYEFMLERLGWAWRRSPNVHEQTQMFAYVRDGGWCWDEYRMLCRIRPNTDFVRIGRSHYYENVSKKGWAPLLRIVHQGRKG